MPGVGRAPASRIDLPPVIGHRGAAAMAPENTLAGLRRAHELGCRWVEFDVRLTVDDELVLMHDERLDRTTDCRGKARALPFVTIGQCDAGRRFDPAFAGERVPSLAEAIALIGQLGLGADVELKPARGDAGSIGRATADLLARAWPEHLPPPLVSSFSCEALAAARERSPQLACAFLIDNPARGRWRRAEALSCHAIGAEQRRLRPAIVAELRAAGYCVLAYTVNDAARACELFDWGVSSVISDVPHMILAAISEASDRPPAALSHDREPLP